jgi:hypothetical protein
MVAAAAPIFPRSFLSSEGFRDVPPPPPPYLLSKPIAGAPSGSRKIVAAAAVFTATSVSSTHATSPTSTKPHLTFPLLPRCCRRSPPLPRVIGGRRRHRSAVALPVFIATSTTHRYGEPSSTYSCLACHPIDARCRATRVGEPPRPSHCRPPHGHSTR